MSPKTLHQNLVRPDIADMAPYTPIVPFDVLSKRLGIPVEDIIKFDANENPYGPSLSVYRALANEKDYHIYPDPDSTALRHALSQYIGIDATHIIAGQGADELIDLIVRLFVTPEDAVINCPPTFGMYRFDTELNGRKIIDVERKNVNVAGSAAALASLSDVRQLQENVQKIVEERERLYPALQNFDFLDPYPSEANFILSRVVGRDAAGLKAALSERGILI